MPAKSKPKDEFISLRLDKSLIDSLARIEEEMDRPRSYIVRKAIEEFIQRNAGKTNR